MNRPNNFLIVIIIVALGLFVMSLLSPAMVCRYGETRSGLDILSYGYAGLFVLDPRWYANPMALWLIFRMLFRKPRRVRVRVTLAIVGFVLLCVLTSPLIPAMACGGGAGGPTTSEGLAYGGYLWMLSMTIIALCALAATPASATRKTH